MARVWLLDSSRCDLCGGQWFEEEAVGGKKKCGNFSGTGWRKLHGGGPTFRKNYEGYKLFIIQIHNMFFFWEREREQEIYFLTSWIFNLCTHKMQKHGYMYACHTLMVCCHLYCIASGSSTSSFFLMKYNFNLVSLTFEMPWVYDWNLYPDHFELFFCVFMDTE